MTMPAITTRRYGLLAEFEDAEHAVEAVHAARAAGYRRMDAFAPFPVEELSEALGMHRTRMPLIVLIGALTGGTCGYLLQYWAHVIHYPMNIGGRPLHSWPMFIPVTFEMTILVGALSAVLGMLAWNGLPRPHHPLFSVPQFARATQDRFFVCIEASDPVFDFEVTSRLLEEHHPIGLYDVAK